MCNEDRAVRQAGVLDRDARACQRARQQHEALRRAGAHDDRLRIGDHPAHAAQVLGQSPSQLSRAARVRIAEGSIGRLAHGLAYCAQPRPARKGGEIGIAREEVEICARDSGSVAARPRRSAASATNVPAPGRATR